jgi:hypothetical protein
MLAADLVFLSASPDSFIGTNKPCGHLGFAGLFLLMAGAFCAVLSIMISRQCMYQTAWSSFGLMKLYHDRRRRWLLGSAWLIAGGTLVYVLAMLGQVFVGRCFWTPV